MEGEFLWWSVPHEGATVLVVESLWGKRRIFVPGRRCSPLMVRECSKHMVAYSLQALMAVGWELDPANMVGISILTEGAGVPFFEAFDLVWPGQQVGGLLNVWARRQLEWGWAPHFLRGCLNRILSWLKNSSGTYAQFAARMKGVDATLREHPVPGAVGVISDIGATGATLQEVVPVVADWFEYLVFTSPCTSAEAARKFVETATACGMSSANLAVVASEGFFGLHPNGTFLPLQLPGTITSRGNITMSRAVYPHPDFCHIGAGGLAANWPELYAEELRQDEERFGPIRRFSSLEEAMSCAEVRWPDDFGSPF